MHPHSFSPACAPKRDQKKVRTAWASLRLGGRELSLLVVENLSALVDVERLLADEAAEEPPYWAHLWSGSMVLARRLETYGVGAGQRLLDVGCGLGVVALAAAALGARAFAFDRESQALALLSASAKANGLRVFAWCGDLLLPATEASFDWICAADVTYDPRLQQALLAFAERSLAPTGTLLCAESVRLYDTDWLRPVEERGWNVTSSLVREEDQERPVWVRLTAIRR
jgi:predicted nicotinamide N-methyase